MTRTAEHGIPPELAAQMTPAVRAFALALAAAIDQLRAEVRAITLWDLTCDQELGKLTLKEGDVRTRTFSPDGKMLARGGMDDIIHLWNVPGRELLAVFKEKKAPDAHILSLAFSPDSKTLAAGTELDMIKLFDVIAKKPSGTLPFKESDVEALAFSPEGNAGEDGVILLFDVAERKEVARLTGHKGSVKALAFTRDGKTIISASKDRTVRLWDAATGKESTQPLTQASAVNTISLSADGSRFAVGATNRVVRLWALVPNATPQKATTLPAAIQVPDGYVHLLAAEAEGVQMYVSEAAGQGFKWTFRAPLADLKVMGKVDGYHYAGPTWELKGGCQVVRDDTEPIRSVASPDGKGNIPWLLIKLKADEKNTGRLAGAVYVQRVNTQGGDAPPELPKRAGTEVGVKYRATYHFFSKK